MSGIDALLGVWVVFGLSGGTGAAVWLEDLVKGDITLPMRIAAGVSAAVFAPLLLLGALVIGGRDLYRAIFPKKVELPEARIHR